MAGDFYFRLPVEQAKKAKKAIVCDRQENTVQILNFKTLILPFTFISFFCLIESMRKLYFILRLRNLSESHARTGKSYSFIEA